MQSRVISYASGHLGAGPKRRGRMPLVAALCLAVLPAGLVTVRHDSLQMDAVTGSRRVVSTWPMGITTGGTIQASALELRLNAMGVRWTRDWHSMSTYGYSMSGVRTSRGCGSAPPVYGGAWLSQYVAVATDQEVREFVGVMQSGSAEQQRSAISVASDVAFRPAAPAGSP
jgi:hypothetical protein